MVKQHPALSRVKRIAGASLVLTGLLVTAGCTAAAEKAPAAASEEKAPEVEAVVDECADATVKGDAVVGVPASNSAGEYCTVVVNPDSAALKYDSAKTDPRLYEMGYTDEQLKNMQRQAVEFAVEYLVDHPSAGQSTAEAGAWLLDRGPDVLAQEVIDGYAKTIDLPDLLVGFDLNFGSHPILPQLLSEGDTRVKRATLSVEAVSVRVTDDGPTDDAEVVVKKLVTYRVNPSTYLALRNTIFGGDVADGHMTAEEAEARIATETENLDLGKPMFIDLERVTKIAYPAQAVREMAKDPKVVGLNTTIPKGLGDVIAYN